MCTLAQMGMHTNGEGETQSYAATQTSKERDCIRTPSTNLSTQARAQKPSCMNSDSCSWMQPTLTHAHKHATWFTEALTQTHREQTKREGELCSTPARINGSGREKRLSPVLTRARP